MKRALILLSALILFATTAQADTWTIDTNAPVTGQKIKAKVLITYYDEFTQKIIKRQYNPTSILFNLDEDVDGTTDTLLDVSGDTFGLTASLHGSIMRLYRGAFIACSYSSANETDNPFNYDDGIVSISGDKLKATSVDGQISFLTKTPGAIKFKFRYTAAGRADDGTAVKIQAIVSGVALPEAL